jgi:hypothetical protein
MSKVQRNYFITDVALFYFDFEADILTFRVLLLLEPDCFRIFLKTLRRVQYRLELSEQFSVQA